MPDMVAVAAAAIVIVAVLVAMRSGRIRPEDARKLIAEGARLVDVRSADEFAGGHLPGAVNLPLAALRADPGQLPAATPIIVYCRSGARSALAARALRAAGRREVHDLGAMANWQRGVS